MAASSEAKDGDFAIYASIAATSDTISERPSHYSSRGRQRPMTARVAGSSSRMTTSSRLLSESSGTRVAVAAPTISSARGTYADPEMKKRQQQEIVVSGLNINASDISSEEEEPEETTDDLEAVVEKSSSVEHILFQDEALINLIEPAVKKVGGGGAVSLSAFQVGSRIPLLHHSYLITLSAANAKATLKIRLI